MPFLALPNGAVVELVHTLGGSVCETTFTFVKRPFVGVPTLTELGTTTDVWWRTYVLPYLSVSLTYVRYVVTDVSAPAGSSVTALAPLGTTGGQGGGPQPANVSARMNYTVEIPPGGKKGCSFVPGIPIGATTGNHLHDDWRIALNDAYSNLIDLANLHNWQWVVASKWSAGALRAAAIPYRVDITEITSSLVSQRRSRLHNEPLP